MKNKMLIICAIFISLILIISNVQAANLIQVNIYEEDYILSKTEGLNLPFFNENVEKTVYDEDVNHSGITLGVGEIEVLKHLKGIHFLSANDRVSIKGSIDYPLIIAENVVIEGKITGDAIIYAPSVYIKEGAEILGDILISATEVEIAGTVKGNVIASVEGTLKVTGKIDNSLRATVGNISIAEGSVNGELVLQTNADTKDVIAKYPNAQINKIEVENTSNIKSEIIKGVVTVLCFLVIGFIFVKKEENCVTKIYNKLKDNVTGVILVGVAVLLPSIAVITTLVLISLFGLSIVAVPVLIIYLALIIVCCMLSVLIVGTVIFEAIKYNVIKKLENNLTIKKLGLLLIIYTVLYTLTVIPAISLYVMIILDVLATGIVVTSVIKKKNK